MTTIFDNGNGSGPDPRAWSAGDACSRAGRLNQARAGLYEAAVVAGAGGAGMDAAGGPGKRGLPAALAGALDSVQIDVDRPVFQATTLVQDSFTRTVSNGWGTATVGGTYATPASNAANADGGSDFSSTAMAVGPEGTIYAEWVRSVRGDRSVNVRRKGPGDSIFGERRTIISRVMSYRYSTEPLR